MARQTTFNAQEQQRQHWDIQAKIEKVHHNREIHNILGDRRIRSIPDFKPENVPEKEFELNEIVRKTFKDRAKIEYHSMTYDFFRVGELSPVKFSSPE